MSGFITVKLRGDNYRVQKRLPGNGSTTITSNKLFFIRSWYRISVITKDRYIDQSSGNPGQWAITVFDWFALPKEASVEGDTSIVELSHSTILVVPRGMHVAETTEHTIHTD